MFGGTQDQSASILIQEIIDSETSLKGSIIFSITGIEKDIRILMKNSLEDWKVKKIR